MLLAATLALLASRGPTLLAFALALLGLPAAVGSSVIIVTVLLLIQGVAFCLGLELRGN